MYTKGNYFQWSFQAPFIAIIVYTKGNVSLILNIDCKFALHYFHQLLSGV